LFSSSVEIIGVVKVKRFQDEIRAAQDFLIKSQQTGAGWGYHAHASQAFPEPTIYSLLALSNTTFQADNTLSWLSSLVNADGQLHLPGDDLPNWASAHLVIALIHLDQLPEVRQASANWLLKWESEYIENNEVVDFDTSLVGWSWISDTFSWVQPTSYAVLALKLSGLKSHNRVKEAEMLLLDRMCLQGGWNFGNPEVLDRPINPSSVDTAAALFALQDLSAAAQAIEMGLAVLEKETLSYPSTLSLAMSILCLQLYDRPTEVYVDLLRKRQEADGSWREMIWWTAMAVIALQTVDGGKNVFQL
jgi:hypothetical protein